MNNNKFIFFDIDGTIYDYYDGVPASTKEAVRLLHENGHMVCLCTGRTKVMIFDEILQMGFDGIIAGGGTYVEWKGQQIFRQDMSKSETKRLITVMQQNRFAVFAEGMEYMYYDPDYVDDGLNETYRIYQLMLPGRVLPIDFETMNCAKISARYTENSDAKPVIKAVEDDYYWTVHNDILFETIPKSSSKAKGFEKLKNFLDIDPENCFAFGDSYNDYDMLKAVKYGVVMGNGNEELKKRIPLHTEDMKDDGVYNALKRLGLI